MIRKYVKRSLVVVVVAGVLSGLASCETAPHSSAFLEQARRAVTQAEADPNVGKYAPTELDRARKLLVNAEESATQKGADDQTASHYAYLTTQMARIAQQRAQEQVAITRIKFGETERQKVLLTARGGEVNPAEPQRLAAQLENMQASHSSRGILL
jgi:hypothetical protein